jgi:hypothetical protein
MGTLPDESGHPDTLSSNGRVIVICGENIAWYSTDGLQWQSVQLPETAIVNYQGHGMVYYQGYFIVPTMSTHFLVSTNGTEWTVVEPTDTLVNVQINGISCIETQL